jgi:ubiquitin thioesterase protein OTUB1
LDEFNYNPGFYVKVQNLCKTYQKYRKTRRDGSCFYRALAFSIFEGIYLKNDKGLKEKMIKKLK